MPSHPKSHHEDRTKLLRLQAGLGNALPGVEIIGASYDPFAGYASPLYVISNIFDWANAPTSTFNYLGTTYNKPSAVSAQDISSTETEIVVGEDIETYQQNLAVSVNVGGSYNFFSGSLSTDFSSQLTTDSDRSFSRIQENIELWSLQLTVDSTTRGFLVQSFRDTLDGLNVSDPDVCQNFFNHYGSHILTGVVLGGRALRTSATNKYTVDRSYELSVTAKESFRFAAGQVTADERAKYSTAVSSFENNSVTNETAFGGSPDLGAQVFSNGITNSDDFDAWRKSVITAPIFIDFTKVNPLTPIWELCADDDAGKKIKHGLSAYYTSTWAPQNSDALRQRPDFVSKLTVVTGDSSNIQPPLGYTRIDYDLNSKAGGKFIYAGYAKEKYQAFGSNKDAVTDIKIIYDNDPTPDGYIKLPNDLNEGAHGSFIYLCYKLEPYDENKAILDMQAIGGNDQNVAAPYHYVKVDSDLNKGAGGEYVYLCYSKRGT